MFAGLPRTAGFEFQRERLFAGGRWVLFFFFFLCPLGDLDLHGCGMDVGSRGWMIYYIRTFIHTFIHTYIHTVRLGVGGGWVGMYILDLGATSLRLFARTASAGPSASR